MGAEVSDFSLSHTCLVWKIVSDSPSQMENEVYALCFMCFHFIFPLKLMRYTFLQHILAANIRYAEPRSRRLCLAKFLIQIEASFWQNVRS